jgi:hypothetical protein
MPEAPAPPPAGHSRGAPEAPPRVLVSTTIARRPPLMVLDGGAEDSSPRAALNRGSAGARRTPRPGLRLLREAPAVVRVGPRLGLGARHEAPSGARRTPRPGLRLLREAPRIVRAAPRLGLRAPHEAPSGARRPPRPGPRLLREARSGEPLPVARVGACAAGRRPSRPRLQVLSDAGQASVELVAALPVIVAVVALAWQALLAGQAVWEARVASRAAARANAVGGDAAAAARAHLPSKLEDGLKVEAEAGGDVRVSLRVPTVLPSVRVGRVGATSHFRPQGG